MEIYARRSSLESLVGDVSRETFERLCIYQDLLARWQSVKNLISRKDLSDIWLRHFLDSAQLLPVMSAARHWVDMGSGAGFPGLVIAILLKEKDCAAKVQLIESDHRKCAFLREVSRETQVAVEVHCGRIDDVIPDIDIPDVVTARALAPLSRLIEYSFPLLEHGAVGLFPKGQHLAFELTQISELDMIKTLLINSKTDTKSKIVMVEYRDCAP